MRSASIVRAILATVAIATFFALVTMFAAPGAAQQGGNQSCETPAPGEPPSSCCGPGHNPPQHNCPPPDDPNRSGQRYTRETNCTPRDDNGTLCGANETSDANSSGFQFDQGGSVFTTFTPVFMTDKPFTNYGSGPGCGNTQGTTPSRAGLGIDPPENAARVQSVQNLHQLLTPFVCHRFYLNALQAPVGFVPGRVLLRLWVVSPVDVASASPAVGAYDQAMTGILGYGDADLAACFWIVHNGIVQTGEESSSYDPRGGRQRFCADGPQEYKAGVPQLIAIDADFGGLYYKPGDRLGLDVELYTNVPDCGIITTTGPTCAAMELLIGGRYTSLALVEGWPTFDEYHKVSGSDFKKREYQDQEPPRSTKPPTDYPYVNRTAGGQTAGNETPGYDTELGRIGSDANDSVFRASFTGQQTHRVARETPVFHVPGPGPLLVLVGTLAAAAVALRARRD